MTLSNVRDFSKIRDSRLRQFYCPYFHPNQVIMPLTWGEDVKLINYCSRFNEETSSNKCSHCLTFPHLSKFRNSQISIENAWEIVRKGRILVE